MMSARTWLLNRLWYVHPTAILTVQAPPDVCIRAIAEAAKPSTHRLHLRNLFADGRRYYLNPLRGGGFWMTSSSKLPWRRRARTSFSAVLMAEFSPVSEGVTRIRLRSRMRLLFFVDIFFVPLFMSTILIFAPWPKLTIATLIVILFSLSWAGHRLSAALQATDMVFFIEKALEDIASVKIPELEAGALEVVTPNPEFHTEWQKFYQQHKDEA